MHLSSEFQEIRKMGGAQKNVSNPERTFSERMETGPGSIGGLEYPIFDLARFGLQGPRVCPAQRGTMALGDTSTLVHPGALRGKPPVS